MTAPDRIVATLRDEIRRGILAPGTPLPQDELARRFEVSRNPLRESLAVLAGEGLVTLRPGRRAIVTQLTAAEIAELYDLRIAVECTLAAPVVEATAPRDLERMRQAAQYAADAEDGIPWLDANYHFHRVLYALADRPRTQALCEQLLTTSQPYSALNVGALGGRAVADAEHAQMVEAVAARDADALADLIATHLRHARQALLAAQG